MLAPYLILLALALATQASAQDDNEFSITSAPFNLVVLSDDPILNGDTLSACHTEVAGESLCLSHSETEPYEPAVLYHNTTIDAITNVRLRVVYPHFLSLPNANEIDNSMYYQEWGT
jgi:hypothetical protein